jgi:hypothetical protein
MKYNIGVSMNCILRRSVSSVLMKYKSPFLNAAFKISRKSIDTKTDLPSHAPGQVRPNRRTCSLALISEALDFSQSMSSTASVPANSR